MSLHLAVKIHTSKHLKDCDRNAAALQDTVKKTKWVLDLVQGLIADNDASSEALQSQHATDLVRFTMHVSLWSDPACLLCETATQKVTWHVTHCIDCIPHKSVQ